MSRRFVRGFTGASDADAPGSRGEPCLRADARRNRVRVIEAAHAVFSTRGPGARMEEVAERAGVGVGTVYRHFSNKEALLEALLAERLGQLVVVARDALEGPEPWEAFAGAMRRFVRMAAEDRAFARTISLFEKEGELAEVRRELVRLLRQLVQRAQEVGEMRPDVFAEDLPVLFLGAGLLTGHEVPPARRELYVEIILDGLRHKTGHKRARG